MKRLKYRFKDIINEKLPVIVHCSEKEQETQVFNLLEKDGYNWSTGNKLSVSQWSKYKEKTCYYIKRNKTIEFCYLIVEVILKLIPFLQK